MPMTKDDRIAFSGKIVSADAEVKGLDTAAGQIGVEQAKIQKLDTANKNLFDPPNAMVNLYQSELQVLNGITRTTITEQTIQDAAAKKIQNAFFPNDLSTTVPSLVSLRNVWPRTTPFALGFGIGKTYVETYPGTVTKESDVLAPVTALISSINAAYSDIEKTSGQHVVTANGTCSLPSYTTQSTCLAATPTPGVWTPGLSSIASYPEPIADKSTLVGLVTTFKNFLTAELALVPTDPQNVTQNNAAKASLNTCISAINTWLAYPDFQAVPGTVTYLTFPSYDSNLLAPTKLHSTQLTALSSALSTRLSYVSTRTSQIITYLGNVSQDINTGEITSSSGLYGKRFGLLLLRLNALGGSLTQLNSLQTAGGAQATIKANTISTKNTYSTLIPTSALMANASGSNIIHLIAPTLFAAGDTVYVYAEGQEELLRGVKSIQGNMVTLSDIVPAKYTTSSKARMYKDLT